MTNHAKILLFIVSMMAVDRTHPANAHDQYCQLKSNDIAAHVLALKTQLPEPPWGKRATDLTEKYLRNIDPKKAHCYARVEYYAANPSETYHMLVVEAGDGKQCIQDFEVKGCNTEFSLDGGHAYWLVSYRGAAFEVTPSFAEFGLVFVPDWKQQ